MGATKSWCQLEIPGVKTFGCRIDTQGLDDFEVIG
jgi:hypothetical protein